MKIISKIKQFVLLLPVMAGMAFFQSCTEEIDTSARYTFTGNTIISYLQEYPEVYGEYCALLDKVNVSDFSNSKISQLLSARGNYTCFAPTNEAIHNYLAHLVDSGVISDSTWDAPEFLAVNPETGKQDLLNEIQETIVYNSLIDGGDEIEAYQTSDFSERAELAQMLGLANMMNRKLQVTIGNGAKYAINGSNISDTNCNIYTINGRIHQVDKVIAPSTETASQFFAKMVKDKKYGFFTYAALLDACGLYAELDKSEDEVYYQKRMKGELEDLPQHPTFKGSGGPSPKTPGILPERKYFGYTLFLESDEWWEKTLGITDSTIHNMNPEELVAMVAAKVVENKWALSSASTGTDYSDPNNALNQFVTYHIIPAKIEPNKLVIHFNELWYNLTDKVKKASVYDYYTTMGKRRLLKTYEAAKTVDGKRNVIYLNRFPTLNNATDGDYTEIACEDGKQGVEIITEGNPETYNGYIYRLNDVLCYNDNTVETMGKERIRIDVATMFPELMTNDIRCNENFSYQHQCVGFPQSVKYQYLENVDISDNTNFYYLTGRINNTSSWANYQGDELNVVGNYEMTMKLPPVPKDGVYELRMAISANDRRGMCQVYWGTNKNALPAAGIPFDMRMGGKQWYLKGQAAIDGIVGYEDDVEDDDEVNAENDKKMRNNSYMKAPNFYYMYGESTSMRKRHQTLRRIIVREEMKADETYYIQFKSVLEDKETEFFMDFIEFCPKEVYDNPQTPEDIW